jgi:hypothetical protein
MELGYLKPSTFGIDSCAIQNTAAKYASHFEHLNVIETQVELPPPPPQYDPFIGSSSEFEMRQCRRGTFTSVSDLSLPTDFRHIVLVEALLLADRCTDIHILDSDSELEKFMRKLAYAAFADTGVSMPLTLGSVVGGGVLDSDLVFFARDLSRRFNSCCVMFGRKMSDAVAARRVEHCRACELLLMLPPPLEIPFLEWRRNGSKMALSSPFILTGNFGIPPSPSPIRSLSSHRKSTPLGGRPRITYEEINMRRHVELACGISSAKAPLAYYGIGFHFYMIN